MSGPQQVTAVLTDSQSQLLLPPCLPALFTVSPADTLSRKCNGKGQPITGHENPEEEWRYSFTISSTWALDGDGWSVPRPSRFTPGKEPVPFVQELGGPQGRSGRVRKISSLPGFDPRPV
jgi:hypothetical protein